MLRDVIGPAGGPALFTGRGIKKKLFLPGIDVLFQIFSQVQAIVIQAGIRVLHPFTIKNYLLHRSSRLNG